MKKETKKAPTIRFRGFTDDWEQRKFSELFKRRMERNNGQFDKTKWISVANMYYQDPDKVTSNNIDTRTYVLRLGDISFEGHSNKEFKIGRFVENDIGDGVISELFPIYQHITSYDLNFWKHYINIENIMFPKLQRCIEVSYTSSNKLSEKFFLKESILVPAILEQKKIGTYLKKIDNLITLHQRKLDQLKTLKKYFLQNMFPAKGEKVPRIRFKGFTGDWEQHKLDNLCLIIDTKHATAPITNEKTSYRMIRTDCVRNGRLLVENMDSVTKEIYDKWSERIHLKAGDIVFTREAPMGESAIIPDDGNSYFPGQRIVTIRSKGNVSTLFINYLIYANEFRREIRIRDSAATTVANFGIPSIKNYVAQLPCVKEQRKIGKYFNQLDNIITLHQRKLEQLQTMKKFMLQNLFI